MEEIKNTINTEEINKFSQLADEWWKIDGKFKTLHKFNPILSLIHISEPTRPY